MDTYGCLYIMSYIPLFFFSTCPYNFLLLVISYLLAPMHIRIECIMAPRNVINQKNLFDIS